MSEKNETLIIHAQDFKGEITRNAKGDYQWSAESRGTSPEEVAAKLFQFDNLMKQRFHAIQAEPKLATP